MVLRATGKAVIVAFAMLGCVWGGAAPSTVGKQLQSPLGPGRQGSSILQRVTTEEEATTTCPSISHHCKCGAAQRKQTGSLGPCGGLINDWKAWEWQGGKDEVLHCAGVVGSQVEAFKIICNSTMRKTRDTQVTIQQ